VAAEEDVVDEGEVEVEDAAGAGEIVDGVLINHNLLHRHN
jgi:hypothetical protein